VRIIFIILCLVSLAAACDDGTPITEPTETRCDEELAQETAIYCAGYSYCGRDVSDTIERCASSMLESAVLIVDHAADTGNCGVSLLGYYHCVNSLTCEEFDTMLDAVALKNPHECLAERVAASLYCDYDILAGP